MFYQFNHLGSPDYLRTERGINFSFPPHLHQCFEVIVVRSGEMKITVDKQEFLLVAGEALLIFPNQIHALESTNSEHLLCIFSPNLVKAFSTKITDKVPRNNKFIPDEYLVNALDKLDMDSSTAIKKGILYSLCGHFDETAEYSIRQAENEKLLYRIFSFVEEEFASDCSLAKLSTSIGYDYSYLSRYFKKIVGTSFNSYVNHYRLSHACYLLENTTQPILRCALDSGYSSLRSFNRNFKEHFQMTPAEYRKNIKKDNSISTSV